MSGDTGERGREESDADAADAGSEEYAGMLGTLDTAIAEAERKVESGRVYDAANEKVRIKWIRCLAYAVNVRRQVTTDRDLEELTERLEAVESEQERDGVSA